MTLPGDDSQPQQRPLEPQVLSGGELPSLDSSSYSPSNILGQRRIHIPLVVADHGMYVLASRFVGGTFTYLQTPSDPVIRSAVGRTFENDSYIRRLASRTANAGRDLSSRPFPADNEPFQIFLAQSFSYTVTYTLTFELNLSGGSGNDYCSRYIRSRAATPDRLGSLELYPLSSLSLFVRSFNPPIEFITALLHISSLLSAEVSSENRLFWRAFSFYVF